MADNTHLKQKRLIDRFGRVIDYLRISITDRCNLRCIYCMPYEGVKFKPHHQILSYEQIAEIVKIGVNLGIKKVRLTGGEPLVRKDMTTLVRYLSSIKGIDDLAMTTNGILLKRFAQELKDAGLKRVNISLDSLDPKKYSSITMGGDINDVFSGIEAAKKAGLLPIKINVVVIPGINEDEIGSFREFAKKETVKIQFISRMQINDINNSRGANLSFIDRPPPCSICNRMRLTADGKLKPCLLSDLEVDVYPVRSKAQDATVPPLTGTSNGVYAQPKIEEAFLKVIEIKPRSGKVCQTREMFQIGG